MSGISLFNDSKKPELYDHLLQLIDLRFGNGGDPVSFHE
jgi:hypothetical protein